MESELRPAAAQLENRQWRFEVRLLSLPQGDQAREIASAPAVAGRRLANALACACGTECTVLIEEPETPRRGTATGGGGRGREIAARTHHIDGTGHDWAMEPQATWWGGRSPVLGGYQNPHGTRSEAYDTECAARARVLETASRRQTVPE